MIPPFLLLLIKGALATGAQAAVTNVAIRALWEVARRTPGGLDDEAILSLARAAGVKLPGAPEALKPSPLDTPEKP